MKTDDTMRQLFAQLPDDRLPADFNRKMMEKIRLEAVKREKTEKLKNILTYVLCGVVMAGAGVLAFYLAGFTFKMPEWPDFSSWQWTFRKLDLDVFKSPWFLFSFYIGFIGLLLLIVDSILRRHYHKFF